MIYSEDKSPSLISFGEILWDVIEGEFHLGGAALNLAAHASHLGMSALLVSCVGEDDLGRRAIHEARKMGVDVAGIGTQPDYPTGTVQVSLTCGQPEYTIHAPVAWDFITTASDGHGDLRSQHVDAVCFGTLAQRAPVSRQTLRDLLDSRSDIPSFYDVNLRQCYFTEDVLEWGFRRAQVVKVNNMEAHVIGRLLFEEELTSEAFARRLQDAYDVEVVLVTLGADGCLVASPSGIAHVNGHSVAVVDTIGAGDAFSAGFLSAWLRGHSPSRAAQIGNTLGAYVATRRGAIPEYSENIRALLRELVARAEIGVNNANIH